MSVAGRPPGTFGRAASNSLEDVQLLVFRSEFFRLVKAEVFKMEEDLLLESWEMEEETPPEQVFPGRLENPILRQVHYNPFEITVPHQCIIEAV